MIVPQLLPWNLWILQPLLKNSPSGPSASQEPPAKQPRICHSEVGVFVGSHCDPVSDSDKYRLIKEHFVPELTYKFPRHHVGITTSTGGFQHISGYSIVSEMMEDTVSHVHCFVDQLLCLGQTLGQSHSLTSGRLLRYQASMTTNSSIDPLWLRWKSF